MRLKPFHLSLVVAAIAAPVLVASARQTPKTAPEVPFVPTPMDIVTAMLQMANVNERDLVYDLGSGDGRIVITAAQKYGARGVGIDIDPQRIMEARSNARSAQVADRVQFRQQDLFDVDLAPASVVTMYLLPNVNLRLRPRLVSQLRPGTRVVSHYFDLGEWEPDERRTVGQHDVYLWVVPARVAGTWQWELTNGSGQSRYTARLDQQFQKVSGTVQNGGTSMRIENPILMGDAVGFTTAHREGDRVITMNYAGKVNGQGLVGKVKINGGKAPVELPWQARPRP